MSEPSYEIGKMLHRRRVEQGITLAQLAKTCGITRAYAFQVTRGSSRPSVEVAKKILTALNVCKVDAALIISAWAFEAHAQSARWYALRDALTGKGGSK